MKQQHAVVVTANTCITQNFGAYCQPGLEGVNCIADELLKNITIFAARRFLLLQVKLAMMVLQAWCVFSDSPSPISVISSSKLRTIPSERKIREFSKEEVDMGAVMVIPEQSTGKQSTADAHKKQMEVASDVVVQKLKDASKALFVVILMQCWVCMKSEVKSCHRKSLKRIFYYGLMLIISLISILLVFTIRGLMEEPVMNMLHCALDKAICNHDWYNHWNTIRCCTLFKHCSDHHPILASQQISTVHYASSFRFFKAWTSHEYCVRLVQDIWSKLVYGAPMYRVQQKLKWLKPALRA
ncbi:hypothetical protein TSUD_411090 [Trifolium subterraneum]|uniref:Uncharacterized protein n=1 Tax=Trifolium subterraneum TaxID=3900 RepID=A0A2Z6PTB2_TRISU|nr:hypothetical protein TSUD_411090 [Trifolium subterraneum]